MRNRILVHVCALLALGVVMLAAPAIAAAPDTPRAPATVPDPVSPPEMHPLPEPMPEQVHPLVGTPDYGTAENAFGASRSGHVHEGQDVFAPAGTPLVAAADAKVAEAGTDGARGNYVVLQDPKRGVAYVYMHMLEPPLVRGGERVDAGERLGAVGCSGSCWGNHLHFEIRRGADAYGASLDPLPQLRSWERVEQPLPAP